MASLGGRPSLHGDAQGQIRHKVEHQNDDFHRTDEAVKGCVESLPGQGKEFAVHPVHPLFGTGTDHQRKNQQSRIEESTPQKNRRDLVYTHRRFPFKK